MSCPPGNCAAWGAFRLCKPLPPIVIDGSYTPEELQLLWFCWRARSTGEYGGSVPVDLGFDSPGLIDISKTTNLAQVIAYCESRGTLVQQFTNFSRFGFKFNLPNLQASGSFSSWSGGVFGSATSPGGGGGGSGGGGEDPIGGGGSGGDGGGAAICPCTPDNGSDLTVVVCTELDCGAAEPQVQITVCGGTPPYQWIITGQREDVTIVQSGINNRNVSVTPPTNNPDVLGTAYHKNGCCNGSPPTTANAQSNHSCDGSLEGCERSGPNCPGAPEICSCTTPVTCSGNPAGCTGAVACLRACASQLALNGGGDMTDDRSQEMIDEGCVPCQYVMDSTVITVEDADGTTVDTTISVA